MTKPARARAAHAPELAAALAAARSAGELLRRRASEPYRVIRKSLHEMVAEVDLESQRVVLDTLNDAFPSYGVIAEERREVPAVDGPTWIVDPLDGTHNYIAGLPFSAVSIALVDSGAAADAFHLGVIYFPFEDRLFHAVRGGGAFCDDMPIQVSENDRLDKAVVCYDNQLHGDPAVLERLGRVARAAFTVRILGTATGDLCFISRGTVDARVWNATKIVDVAAGQVLLSEAGGKLTDFSGRPLGLAARDVVASNGRVHDALLAALAGDDHAAQTDHEVSS